MKVNCLSFLLLAGVWAPWTADAACLAFESRASTISAATSPHTLLPVDLNHDGHVDVAVVSLSSVGLHLGRGDGTFHGPGHLVPIGEGSFAAGTGDFNRDGHLDVATAGLTSRSITIALGRGDGTASALTIPVASAPYFLHVADVTGDGVSDILLGNANESISIHVGNGEGSVASSPIKGVPSLSQSVAFVTDDFNGDGTTDLVASLSDFSMLATFFGRGDGTFSAGPSVPSAPYGARAIALGDLNRDGIKDVVLGSLSADEIQIYLGTGGGAFQGAGTVRSGKPTWTLHLADYTNDGKLDLALTNQYEYGIRIHVGNGDGTFANVAYLPPQGRYALGIGAADFDGDRRVDVAYAEYDANALGVLENAGDCGGASSKRRSTRH